MRGEKRNADAAGNGNFIFLFPKEVLDHRQKPLGFLQSSLCRRNIFEENKKFISADPAHKIAGAGFPSDRSGQIRQNSISKQMTRGIIYHFKIVNIDHQKRTFFI